MGLIKCSWTLPWFAMIAYFTLCSCGSTTNNNKDKPFNNNNQTMNLKQKSKLIMANNGSTAVIWRADNTIVIYSLPDLEKWHESTFEAIDEVVISSGGSAIGVRHHIDQLTIIDRKGKKEFPLSKTNGHLMGLAISEDGTNVAIALQYHLQNFKDDAPNGAIEIWSQDGILPSASAPVPVLDYVILHGNEDLSWAAYFTANQVGGERYSSIFRKESSAVLTTTNKEVWVRATTFREWVWTVHQENLLGWDRQMKPTHLKGHIGDHLIFSKDGQFLMAYHISKLVDNTDADMDFKIYDLSTVRKIKQQTIFVKNYNEVQLMLTEIPTVHLLRISEEGELKIEVINMNSTH